MITPAEKERERKRRLKMKKKEKEKGKKISTFSPSVIIETLLDSDNIDLTPYAHYQARGILEEYSRILKKGIKLHWAGESNNPRAPQNDDLIHIFPFSTMASLYDGGRVWRILGVERSTDFRGAEFQYVCPSMEDEVALLGGIELRDEQGFVFAEVYGEKDLNNLYIRGHILREWNDNNQLLLRKILERYSSLLADTEKVKELIRQKEEKEEGIIAGSKDNYTKACLVRLKNTIQETTKQRVEKERVIKALSEELSASCRELDVLELRLEGLTSDEGEGEFITMLNEEFDKLKEHPSVEKALVRGNRLEISTKELILKETASETKRKIGRFKIEFHFDSQNFTCINRDYQPYGYQHPHIGGASYDYCLAHSGEIINLINKYQFATAFHLLWNQMNKYTPNDCKLKIANWPIA